MDSRVLKEQASEAFNRMKNLGWYVKSHGIALGVFRFGVTEGLGHTLEVLVKQRARKAEEVGWKTCGAALMVVFLSFLDVFIPTMAKIVSFWDAVGLGMGSLMFTMFVLGYLLKQNIQGLDFPSLSRLIYFGIVIFITLSRHVLMYQASLTVLRKATAHWLGWELNLTVYGVGLALLACTYINAQLTSKYNLLAKLMTCWLLLGPGSFLGWLELMMRIVHFLLAMFVEETAPVNEIMGWIGCWWVVNRLEEFVDGMILYIFEGPSADIIDVGVFLINCVSALMNTYSFEDLVIPPLYVQYGIIALRYILFSLTGLISTFTYCRSMFWSANEKLESTTDQVVYLASVLFLNGLMIALMLKDYYRYKTMDRAEFFFCKKLEYFQQLKEYVQYEEIRKRLAKLSTPPAPDQHIRVVFIGKVSCGKTQLIKTLLTLQGSPDAAKVTDISLIAGSTANSIEYTLRTLDDEEKSKLFLVDTPGLDSSDPNEKDNKANADDDPMELIDFAVLCFNGDSDQDLYQRYVDAVKAICKKNNYKKGSNEYKQAWRRVLLVRTHGDMFAWGLGSLSEQFGKGFSKWPRSLRELLERTCERLNENVLKKNGFEDQLKVSDLYHISTKPKDTYGVEELLKVILELATGTEGQIITLERHVHFHQQTVDLLTQQLNDVASQINRQWIIRKALNIAKMLLDPFFAINQQAWTNSLIETYKNDEHEYKGLNARLEEAKEKLAKAKMDLENLKQQTHDDDDDDDSNAENE